MDISSLIDVTGFMDPAYCERVEERVRVENGHGRMRKLCEWSSVGGGVE